MSNLSQDVIFPSRGDGVLAEKLANGVTVYAGSLLARTVATGLLAKWSDAAGLAFVGQAIRGLVGDGSKEVGYGAGQILQNVNVTGVSDRTSQGKKVYVSTDNPEDFTLTPTTNVRAVGTIKRWRTAAKCDVRLYTEEQYAAQVLVADITALTDSSGGAAANSTIEAVTPPTALTDNGGGTADATVASQAAPAALAAADGVGTNDGTIAAITTGGAAADQAPVIAAIQEIVAKIAEYRTLATTAQNNLKELTTRQAENRAAIVALTDAVAELAAKVNAILAALNAQQ